MGPITHVLASWTIADSFPLEKRDRAMLSWAGVVLDIDGLVVVADIATRLAGTSPTFFYGQYHHMITHGLPAIVLLIGLVGVFARQKWRTMLLTLLITHVHLLCDLLGSRGPGGDDLWPVNYLAPLSNAWSLEWTHQWPLAGWQNTTITLALLAIIGVRAVRRGYSIVGLFSEQADQKVVAALRNRFRTSRSA